MAMTGGFARHLAPGYRDIVGTTFKSWEAYYSRICKVESTTRNYEEYFHATTLPIAVSKGESTPISFFDPLEGSKLTVTPGEYAMGMQVSRRLWDDDLYKAKSAIRQSASSLAKSFAELTEIIGHAPLNDGFTSYGTVDGAATLFATTHPRLDGGGNQANTPTVAAALSLTSYRAGRNQFMKWTDDRGKRLRSMPKVLITGIDLGDRARIMLGTPNEPGSANNDINVLKGTVAVIQSPYITSSTAWYLLGPEHWIKFLWRSRPELDAYDDKDTKGAKFTIWGRLAVTAVHWHDAWGTTGV